MNSKTILPVPEHNHYYCSQSKDLNGYIILDNNKEKVYEVIGKTVATRSHYRIRRVNDGVAIASVDQDQIDNKYEISGTHDQEIASVDITKDNIKLKVSEITYMATTGKRGKHFEFYNDDKIVLTLDKKILSLKDSYHVRFVEEFPSLIAAILPIIIDDFYHHGPSN